MTKETRERWAARIQAWRESGLTPDAFAFGKGFAGTSLRAAIAELERGGRARPQRTSRSLPAPAPTPRFLPLVATGTTPAGPVSSVEVLVEVGTARIRVARGADLALVGELVRELQRGGSR